MIAMQSGDMETCENVLKTVQGIKDHDKIPLVKRALGSFTLSKVLNTVVEELKTQKIAEGTPEATYRDAVNQCITGNIETAVDQLISLVKSKTHPGAKDVFYFFFFFFFFCFVFFMFF